MLADNQLNINAHRTMTFEGERCSGADADRSTMTIDGRLTIRGVSKGPDEHAIPPDRWRPVICVASSESPTTRTSASVLLLFSAGSVRNQENMTLGFDFQSVANN